MARIRKSRKSRKTKTKIYIDNNGYKRFRDSDRLVHRWMAYKYLYKRSLHFHSFSHYHVHHKDKNKLNNDVSNLMMLAPEEHNAIHKFSAQSPSRIKMLESANINTTPYSPRIADQTTIFQIIVKLITGMAIIFAIYIFMIFIFAIIAAT